MSFFGSYWSRLRRPQVIFANSLLTPLNTPILSVPALQLPSAVVRISFGNIFPKNAEFLPANIINDTLPAHRSEYPSHVVIATGALPKDEEVGLGISSPTLNWSFSLRLPGFISIFYAEFLALLAIPKLDSANSSVILLTDSRSVCMALSSEAFNTILETLYSCVPMHSRTQDSARLAARSLWVNPQ